MPDSMKHSSPLEGNGSLPSEEILCMVWNLKVHYRIHKNPLLDPVRIQINSAHAVSQKTYVLPYAYL